MSGFFPSSVVHKFKPPGTVPLCGSCGLFKTCEHPKMLPYGKGRRGVLFVGEAPGETEDRQGRPFVGKAGQFLRETLRVLDVDLDKDVWTTNALICRPPDNKIPDPKRQVGYCHPNLRRTIETFEPRVIITAGQIALRSALTGYWDGVDALERWVGNRIPLQPHWICPTYHPSYLLRMKNPVLNQLFVEHLRQAFAIDRPPKPVALGAYELLMEEKQAVRAILAFDEAGGWLAYDYECNCLKPEWPLARVFCCSMSNGKRTIAYPWTERTKAATGQVLRSPRTRKIASNLKMEERWTLKEFGHGARRWGWDTMLAAHALDNRAGVCSLKFQSLVRLGVSIYNRHIDPYLESHNGPYNRIKEIDLLQLLFYNATDSFLEYKLAMRQRRDLGYDLEAKN